MEDDEKPEVSDETIEPDPELKMTGHPADMRPAATIAPSPRTVTNLSSAMRTIE